MKLLTRLILSICALVVTASCHGQPADRVRLKQEESPPVEPARRSSAVPRIPNPDYHPQPGDRAVLFGYDEDGDQAYETWGAVNSHAYRELWKTIRAKDRVGYDLLKDEGDVVKTELNTSVLVIEIERSDEKWMPDAAVVRAVDGPHRGSKLWVTWFHVCRIMDNPAYSVPPSRPKTDAVSSARGAAPLPWLPERGYMPKVGDTALLFFYGLVSEAFENPRVYASREAIDRIQKETAKTKGPLSLEQRREEIELPCFTPVRVLEIEQPIDGPGLLLAKVEVQEGPSRGSRYWCYRWCVGRLVPRPGAPRDQKLPSPEMLPGARPIAPKGRILRDADGGVIPTGPDGKYTPEERQTIHEGAMRQMADSYLNIAENLRKSGKIAQARKQYLEVIAKFPKHPEAKKAKERLKTLPPG